MPRSTTQSSVVLGSEAASLSYRPKTPGDWSIDVRTIQDALDQLGGGSGDVTGPASSVTNAIAVFSDTTGKVINDSAGPISINTSPSIPGFVFDGSGAQTGVLDFNTVSGFFSFDQDVRLDLTKAVEFGDAAVYIQSPTDGDLNIVADDTVQVYGSVSTVVGVEGNVELGVGSQATVRDFTPKTASKYNAGTPSLPFAEFCGDMFRLLEKSSDPSEPAEGECIIWLTDGGGTKGSDGDVMIASKAGGTTRYATLFDHSTGSVW